MRFKDSSTAAPGGKRTFQRWLAMMGVALAGSVVFVGLNVGPASATDLGGINMEAACLNQKGIGWDGILTGSTIYDWACENAFTTPVEIAPIDLNRACRIQYSLVDEPVYAAFYDRSNPYSWYCHT